MANSLLKKYNERLLIRNAIESYPGGICFAAENGRPVLVNHMMNSLCVSMTGHTIVNATQMWAEMRAIAIRKNTESGGSREQLLVKSPEDKVWQFEKTCMRLGHFLYFQYTANDATELFQISLQLKENNEKIERQNERKKALLKTIVQNNVEEELLHTKMQIHDDVGQVLIKSRRALSETQSDKDKIALSDEWEMVLSKLKTAAFEENRDTDSQLDELLQVAKLIGCQINIVGNPPAERKVLSLLCESIREALTNAVRHAGADELTVEILKKDDAYNVRISDNGKEAPAKIVEGSGLSMLRKHLELFGATLDYLYENGVVMLIAIPSK